MLRISQLPSHRYRYTVWHELRSTQVKGDQLKAPRVREGPESKEETFYEVTDNGGALIHHDKTGQEKEKYRHQQENWESSLVGIVMLSHFFHLYTVIQVSCNENICHTLHLISRFLVHETCPACDSHCKNEWCMI